MANNKNRKYNQSLYKGTRKGKSLNNNYQKKNSYKNELDNTKSLSQKEINKRRYEARKQRYSEGTNSGKKKVVKLDDTLANNLSNTDIILLKRKKTPIKDDNKKIEKDLPDENAEISINEESITDKEKKLLKLEDELPQNIDVEIENREDIKNNLEENIIDKQTQNTQENNQIEDDFLLKKKKIDIEKTKTFILDKIKKEEKISLEENKDGNKKRVKKYLKEAILFSILITFINILVIWLFDDINVLKIFDIFYVNLIVTIVLSLIISYAISFFVDCLVTEIWVKIKNKQKEGAQNGDSRTK